MKNCMCSVVVAEVQEVQAHPQKFWFGENPCKIPENPGKIRGNLGKICENLCKIPENLCKVPRNTIKNGAQRALIRKNGAQRPLLRKIGPNVVYFGRNGAQLWFDKNGAQNHMKIFFLEVIRKTGLHEKIFAQKVAQNFLRQIWGNSGKNSSHP